MKTFKLLLTAISVAFALGFADLANKNPGQWQPAFFEVLFWMSSLSIGKDYFKS
ncbi:hypothetical protein AB6735_18620 [Mucilaginibacter sp. RCC_168]|uniref:hypothetical protein n=1 Tax=Mucilaginibacter sp. RCC_168 TaxID=3239221 RepID=UPI003525703F